MCDCLNGASCNATTGQCNCKPGFLGYRCKDTCPKGKWGKNCRNNCTCIGENYECSVSDGSCTCEPGWTGGKCDVRKCHDGLYGEDCRKECECVMENTLRLVRVIFDMISTFLSWKNDENSCFSCHPFTGKCKCKAGWDGTTCVRPCSYFTYGDGCSQQCHCNKNNSLCSPMNGTCFCNPGLYFSSSFAFYFFYRC